MSAGEGQRGAGEEGEGERVFKGGARGTQVAWLGWFGCYEIRSLCKALKESN